MCRPPSVCKSISDIVGLISYSLASVDCYLRREQSGTSLPLDGPSRAGGAAGYHHWSVSTAFEQLYCESTSAVFDLSGGGDLARGETGSAEEGGDGQDGEADEGGEGSTVDGKPPWARVGKEGPLPHGGIR